MSDDEYDSIPDPFADAEGVDWEAVLAAPQAGPSGHAERHPSPLNAARSPSSGYFDDDDLDSGVLAEIDEIERQATQSMRTSERLTDSRRGSRICESIPDPVPPAIEDLHGVAPFPPILQVAVLVPHQSLGPVSVDTSNAPGPPSARLNPPEAPNSIPSQLPLKRRHSQSPSPEALKKGKMRAVECKHEDALALLATMEDDYSCPICCDIFVSAHMANPCGHSLCGECGFHWTSVEKKKTCPVCRTNLSRSSKLLPNIALQNTVEKYIEILGAAGHEGWRRGGKLHEEWTERNERWKNQVAKLQKRAPSKTPTATVAAIDLTTVFFQFTDNEAQDPTYEEDDGELVPPAPSHLPRQSRPFTRTRSSRNLVFPVT